MKKLIKIILIILFIYNCSTNCNASDSGILIGDNVFIRNKPNLHGKVLSKLKRNTKLIIIKKVATTDKQYKNWYKVKVKDTNIKGFIYAKYVSLTNSKDVKITSSDVISVTNKGNSIEIISKDNVLKEFKVKGVVSEITKSNHFPYLFIAIYDYENVGIASTFSGIFNLSKLDWVLQFKPEELVNPLILNFSHSGRYTIIDEGSSAGVRGLVIVDLKNKKIVFKSSYITAFKPKWDKNDNLIFYRIIGKTAPGMPPIKNNFITYAQKIRWQNNKEYMINEYKKVHDE